MITTHVLDTAQGRPAAGVPVTLERAAGGGWTLVARSGTDGDGRVRDLGAERLPGTYRLRFDTATYFEAQRQAGFYPYVEVVFEIRDAGAHYHLPLLLSPYGYSTYRGS